MRRLAGGVLMALLAAAPLAAQQHAGMDAMHGEQGMGMCMAWGGDMMENLPPGPGMLIRAKDALGLTEDQVAQLGALQEEAHAEVQAHMRAAMQSRQEAMQALSGTPDLDAYKQALQTAHTEMLEAHMAMVRANVEAGAVLTEAQQKMLDTARSVMRAMHRDADEMGAGHGMGPGQGQGMMHRRGGAPPDTSGVH